MFLKNLKVNTNLHQKYKRQGQSYAKVTGNKALRYSSLA